MRAPLPLGAALAAACHPQSPPSLLRELAARPEPEVLAAIGANPNTPLDLLLRLLPSCPDAILQNPALELLELESPGALATLPMEETLGLLARPVIAEWLARQILTSKEIRRDHRLTMAGSPTTPPGVLLALARTEEPIERCEAAHNPMMPAEAVARLARDPRPAIRAAVARSTAKEEILRALAEDKHPSPRLFARSRLEKRPAERPPRLPLHAAGGASSCGQRHYNEDAFVVCSLPGAFVGMVADGMGGNRSGDAAAKVTIEQIPAVLRLLLPFASESEEADCLFAATTAAHEGVCRLQKDRIYTGVGTTVAAVLLCGDRAHIGHVGDSRVYRLRHGSLEQITRDHSLLNDYLAAFPQLSAEKMAEIPKNIITRALGVSPDASLDLQSLALEAGDLFLLSTDGLHDTLTGEAIKEILQQHAGDAAGAARALVAAADKAGSEDNITAVVVDTGKAPAHAAGFSR